MLFVLYKIELHLPFFSSRRISKIGCKAIESELTREAHSIPAEFEQESNVLSEGRLTAPYQSVQFGFSGRQELTTEAYSIPAEFEQDSNVLSEVRLTAPYQSV